MTARRCHPGHLHLRPPQRGAAAYQGIVTGWSTARQTTRALQAASKTPPDATSVMTARAHHAEAWQRTWTGVMGISAAGRQTNHFYIAVNGTGLIVLQFTEFPGQAAPYDVAADPQVLAMLDAEPGPISAPRSREPHRTEKILTCPCTPADALPIAPRRSSRPRCSAASSAAGIAHATIVTSGYDTSNGTGTLGPAAPGDAITRAQIISRADDWISNQVPYSQTEGWEDSAAGGPYRMDCSGFVSMAWGLTTSMVTSTLPQVATVTDGNISGDTNLNPGDALDYTADHAVLFDHWTDSSGDFAYDAEHTSGQLTNQSTDNINDSTLEGYAMSDFEALQYNNITAAPLDVAFQANTGDLYTYDPATGGSTNVNLGMAAGTSPSIAYSPSGGFEVAFQANTGDLYTYSSTGNSHTNTNLGMAAGTSPSIAYSPTAGFEVAFQANTGHLYTYDPGNNASVNANLGVAAGTSPSIASNGSGFEVAFQANTGHLYTYDPGNNASVNANLGVASGTSPSIASNGSGFEVAFQANTGHLYTYNPGNNASVNANLGVASGTSPSIASSSGVYLVAFQANTGDLYTYNPGSNASVNANLGVASGTSPSITPSGGSYLIAFQANTGHLYTYNPANNTNTNVNLGMAAGTSPAIG